MEQEKRVEKLTDEIEVKIGENGLIVLREPSNGEWNAFDKARYEVKRNKLRDHANRARVDLFDQLVVRIENIEDSQGPITLETKDRIPNRKKAQIVFQCFETADDIEVKNS